MKRAKLGSKAKQTRDVIHGKRFVKDVTVFGTIYTIHALEPHEQDLANGLVNSSMLYRAGQLVGRSSLAYALDAIDGSPIEAEFALPDDLTAEEREALKDPKTLAQWRREQVFAYLMEDSLDDVLQTLVSELNMLGVARKEWLETLAPLSERTPTPAA